MWEALVNQRNEGAKSTAGQSHKLPDGFKNTVSTNYSNTFLFSAFLCHKSSLGMNLLVFSRAWGSKNIAKVS